MRLLVKSESEGINGGILQRSRPNQDIFAESSTGILPVFWANGQSKNVVEGKLYSRTLTRQARVVLILLIFIGCALGGVFRHLGTSLIARLLGESFPWGTLIVNAVGSFLLGIVLGGGIRQMESWFSFDGVHAFAAIGFCGGLTTFSTFSLQTLSLVSESSWGKALANIVGSVALCVFCVVSGYALGEWLTQ